ncbi:hypothetical protein MCOR14_001584 [Pyricularia oryzae]|nr:hypothetical protein MCOR15_000763 [Pyricularia oryzae]KAI6519523.1 hypothetical protein MCOR16_008589 [Pyricularia oryzae]KAI6643955.1 hypothetical protein MCOR14_001584 [Pyricularia oryzae]
MGLALYDTSDPLVGMTEALREQRHESRTRAPRPPRHPPKVRRTKCDGGYGGCAKMRIREHNAFKAAHRLHARPRPGRRHHSSSSFRPSAFDATRMSDVPITIPRQRPRSRIAWVSCATEGVDMHTAGSSDGLPPPAPRRQARRPPSLERQNAFRDPNSSTPRRRRSADYCFQQSDDVSDADVAAVAAAAEEIADLYDMDLLYDEHVRGSEFGFDVLTRNAQEPPQYTVYFCRAAGSKSRGFGRKNDIRSTDGFLAGDPAAHFASPDGEELEWSLDCFDAMSIPDVKMLLDVSDGDDEPGVESTGWVLLNNMMEED